MGEFCMDPDIVLCASKYLQKYAHLTGDPFVFLQEQGLSSSIYDWVIVVPVYNEPLPQLGRLLKQLQVAAQYSSCQVLVIWVFNVPEQATQTCVRHNLKRVALFKSLARDHRSAVSSAVIERINVPIPRKMGVGLARKLGADMALALIENHVIQIPVILNTDADVVLPKSYFQSWQALWRSAQHSTASASAPVLAWTFPFQHDPCHRLSEYFDRYLAYYRHGLQRAGSPYAHYALGSIIGVQASAYAQVRGFPKISGGEDFYLLNKIRKLGLIQQGHEAVDPIVLSARFSDRVPFGTGPLLRARGDALWVPTNEVFDLLKTLLDAVRLDAARKVDQHWEHWQHWEVPSRVLDALAAIGFHRWRQRCARQPLDSQSQKPQFAQRFHDWFDGLRTYQFMKYLMRQQGMQCIL